MRESPCRYDLMREIRTPLPLTGRVPDVGRVMASVARGAGGPEVAGVVGRTSAAEWDDAAITSDASPRHRVPLIWHR